MTETGTSNHLSPGTTLILDGKVYRVETSVRVTVAKGVPFIKTKMKNLMSDELIEKNFKIDQVIDEVSLSDRRLEFLYLEDKDYLFLDVDALEHCSVPMDVVKEKVNYMKEGVAVKAMFYGDIIFSIILPQFLELMVIKTEKIPSSISVSKASKHGILETGAKIEVPLFIDVGDVVKVDTHLSEYIQRI